jgi:hypothetical protein
LRLFVSFQCEKNVMNAAIPANGLLYRSTAYPASAGESRHDRPDNRERDEQPIPLEQEPYVIDNRQ